MNIGDPCYRDRNGVAHAELPHRVRLADGSTRTDPAQWFADEAVLKETGWNFSVVVESDLGVVYE